MLVPHCFDYGSFVVSFGIGKIACNNFFFFFFKIVLASEAFLTSRDS